MGATFDNYGLKGGSKVVVILDVRIPHFYEGQVLRLRDTGRGIRAPDMTNGSGFKWKIWREPNE